MTQFSLECGAVSAIATSPNDDVVVLTHYGDDSVSLIDVTGAAVVQTVVHVDEPFAVAMADTPTGRVYVAKASASCDSVLALDVLAHQVVGTYPLTCAVSELAVSSNGRRLYAGRSGADGADVAVIDTATGAEHSMRIAAAGTATECVRLSPDGRRLFVAVNGASTAELIIVDTHRSRVVSTVEFGSAIRDVALSPDGRTAYVASCGPDFGTVLDVVDVRDARESAVTATYKIGGVAGVVSRLTLSRDGARMYLVGDTSVTILDVRTQHVLGSIATGAAPSCAVESPAGTRLYVADYAGIVTVLAVDAADVAPPTGQDAWRTPRPQHVADVRAFEPSLA